MLLEAMYVQCELFEQEIKAPAFTDIGSYLWCSCGLKNHAEHKEYLQRNQS